MASRSSTTTEVGCGRWFIRDDRDRPLEAGATCGPCWGEAAGFAEISGTRYCHEGKSPTCYERATWASHKSLGLYDLDEVAREFGVELN